jgi:hypothetical protein
MKIKREEQEELVMELETQFYKAIIAMISNEHLKYPAYTIENLIKALRKAILNYCFDDDLLLDLFNMLEFSINYLNETKMKWGEYKLSA